jgi:hypothetical protein
VNSAKEQANLKSDGQPTCDACGGLHFGSFGCPYVKTVCDKCDKPLIEHEGYCFCDGGKTKHAPADRFCTCEMCVAESVRFAKLRKYECRCNCGRECGCPCHDGGNEALFPAKPVAEGVGRAQTPKEEQ